MIGTRSSGTAAVLVGGLAVILWARCRVRRSEMRALALCKLLVRSLADPLPMDRDDARSRVAVYATAHTDDNVATVADGVAELCALLPGMPTVLVHEVDNARLKPPLPNFQGSVLLRRELSARRIKPQVMQGWHHHKMVWILVLIWLQIKMLIKSTFLYELIKYLKFL